jgi:hypothetical protein
MAYPRSWTSVYARGFGCVESEANGPEACHAARLWQLLEGYPAHPRACVPSRAVNCVRMCAAAYILNSPACRGWSRR